MHFSVHQWISKIYINYYKNDHFKWTKKTTDSLSVHWKRVIHQDNYFITWHICKDNCVENPNTVISSWKLLHDFMSVRIFKVVRFFFDFFFLLRSVLSTSTFNDVHQRDSRIWSSMFFQFIFISRRTKYKLSTSSRSCHDVSHTWIHVNIENLIESDKLRDKYYL